MHLFSVVHHFWLAARQTQVRPHHIIRKNKCEQPMQFFRHFFWSLFHCVSPYSLFAAINEEKKLDLFLSLPWFSNIFFSPTTHISLSTRIRIYLYCISFQVNDPTDFACTRIISGILSVASSPTPQIVYEHPSNAVVLEKQCGGSPCDSRTNVTDKWSQGNWLDKRFTHTPHSRLCQSNYSRCSV